MSRCFPSLASFFAAGSLALAGCSGLGGAEHGREEPGPVDGPLGTLEEGQAEEVNHKLTESFVMGVDIIHKLVKDVHDEVMEEDAP